MVIGSWACAGELADDTESPALLPLSECLFIPEVELPASLDLPLDDDDGDGGESVNSSSGTRLLQLSDILTVTRGPTPPV